MSGMSLTLRAALSLPVDLSALEPRRIAQMDPRAVGALTLPQGNGTVRVDQLFDVQRRDSGATARLEIHGADGRLDGVGAGLEDGEIHVHGRAGDYLGRGMRGGIVEVHGDCGAFAGAAMRGGRLTVVGDAGDFLGGPLPGRRHGMRGGTVLIHGRAGDRAGEAMRRGLLVIRGDAGANCASRMIAGTVAVLGHVGPGSGHGMRRGTLLLRELPALPATFNGNGAHRLGFLTLLRAQLAAVDAELAAVLPAHARAERWVGDRSVDGRGEVLVWR